MKTEKLFSKIKAGFYKKIVYLRFLNKEKSILYPPEDVRSCKYF